MEIFRHRSREALRPTQPPVQWVLGLSPELKRSRRGADHPFHPTSKSQRKSRPIPAIPLWTFMFCSGRHFRTSTALLLADPSGRAFQGLDLQPLACWNCGFESRRGCGCLSRVLCVGRYKFLRRADHPSRGVLLDVVCLSVIVKPRQWGSPGPLGSCCDIIIQYSVWRQVQSLLQNDSST